MERWREYNSGRYSNLKIVSIHKKKNLFALIILCELLREKEKRERERERERESN